MSPLTIFKKNTGTANISSKRISKNSFANTYLNISDFNQFAKKIFSENEITEFVQKLDHLGFDFIQNQNIVGLVVQNPNLYFSELILGFLYLLFCIN